MPVLTACRHQDPFLLFDSFFRLSLASYLLERLSIRDLFQLSLFFHHQKFLKNDYIEAENGACELLVTPNHLFNFLLYVPFVHAIGPAPLISEERVDVLEQIGAKLCHYHWFLILHHHLLVNLHSPSKATASAWEARWGSGHLGRLFLVLFIFPLAINTRYEVLVIINLGADRLA